MDVSRASVFLSIILLGGPTAEADSDEQALAKIRSSATQIFLDQASWTLPEAFQNSGLSPSDKQRLVRKWASAAADCLADSLVAYAETADVPLSEMVSDDGSFMLKGDGSESEFFLRLDSCMQSAWASVGADPTGVGTR